MTFDGWAARCQCCYSSHYTTSTKTVLDGLRPAHCTHALWSEMYDRLLNGQKQSAQGVGDGLMEFAGVDKAARSKTGVWKMQEWTYRHGMARVDNAGEKKCKLNLQVKQCAN